MTAVDALIADLELHLAKIERAAPEDIQKRIGFAKVVVYTAIKDGVPLADAMPWINKIIEIERSHDDR